LWDVRRRDRPRTLGTLTGPAGAVYVDTFDTRRPLLATAGADGMVSLWNTDPDQVAASVCAGAGAPLTRSEWREYVPGRPYRHLCQS
jgi:WD40 repeat protein